MNKKIVSIIIFISLFSLAGFTLAESLTIPNPLGDENMTFATLLTDRILPGIAGLITGLGTIMLIVAGIFYVTSAGDPARVTKAKTALMYAIAGIAIGLAASGIVGLIKNVLGVSTT